MPVLQNPVLGGMALGVKGMTSILQGRVAANKQARKLWSDMVIESAKISDPTRAAMVSEGATRIAPAGGIYRDPTTTEYQFLQNPLNTNINYQYGGSLKRPDTRSQNIIGNSQPNVPLTRPFTPNVPLTRPANMPPLNYARPYMFRRPGMSSYLMGRM
ncbi:hypothetical protein LCGC14_0692760 [marine sediment metagenome]|uniref:Uncharacterized protein n=1 Tax=marine sediment metagenome TaxID=412755 RepID=A0A0F9QPV6_9ZZZZ